jgi:hypothetical protein
LSGVVRSPTAPVFRPVKSFAEKEFVPVVESAPIAAQF